jgi:flagellar biosynthesis protein FlhA
MASRDLTVVFFIITIITILIIPLPSFILDFLLTISISLSVLIMLISLYVKNPTDLTTFPTLLLIIVVFRLALNVATTKIILTHGHEGPENVSDIINAFGNFVVSGNFVLGIIIFAILVIINFLVITKGSTRVAEVTARFTLDALPGKQMAIDADLNAGMIDDKVAQERRAKLQQEVSFYGSMDGSAKFVQGDAVAGIIITFVNILGGFLIGVFQHDMEFGVAAETFTLLTIGDGLVGQIPALITSTATGIIITRSNKSSEKNFAEDVINQIVTDHRVLIIVGGIMFLFALVPGLPTFSLGFVALIFLTLGYLIKSAQEGKPFLDTILNRDGQASQPMSAGGAGASTQQAGADGQPHQQEGLKPKEKSIEEIKKEEEETLKEILKTEVLELSLGYQLLKLAEEHQGGDLLEKIRGTRRQIAKAYGFVVPQIRIHDDLHLTPNTYTIMLKGIEIGRGEIEYNKFLAMDSGMVIEEIEGLRTKEPAFGLDAIWIEEDQKDEATIAGYTVVDPSTVISTHLSELIKSNAPEILTRQDVQVLLDRIDEDYPVLVKDVKQEASTGLIQGVLKELLRNKIPIKDMLTILETIADITPITKDLDIIVENVRARLARVITNLYVDDNNLLNILAFDPATEQHILDKVVAQGDKSQLALDSYEIQALINVVSEEAMKMQQRGMTPLLLVEQYIRKHLSDIFEKMPQTKSIVVLSHAEIDAQVNFEIVGTVSIQF